MEQYVAMERTPSTWIEEGDIERRSYAKSTWIPLYVVKEQTLRGVNGNVGYRREFENTDSLIVPLQERERFKTVDWQSVTRFNSDAAWADDESFHPPGCYDGDARFRYPVLRCSFDNGEPSRWEILQELELGLQLVRRADVWIRPDENDIVVAKLDRDSEGKLQAIYCRAEHLRDYLRAKRAALLVTTFVTRTAVEEDFPDLAWDADRRERLFEGGEWEGTNLAIHEGGFPYGEEMHVIRAWRESVNPEDDVPEMPHPSAEPAARSESFVKKRTERKLFSLGGRIWTKHWIEPALLSPRIRRDHVEAQVQFRIEDQEPKTLSGNALGEYRGWLWFRPAVIRLLLSSARGALEWQSADTGEVGPATNRTVQFGVNKLGLINVLGYKVAELPEWAQRMWATHTIGPDGGLAPELHAMQNLARHPGTMAPEMMLWNNLQVLQKRTQKLYGQPILQNLPEKTVFFRQVHRFYGGSFEELCELCKEIHRVVSEPIDLGLINDKIDPAQAAAAKKNGLRQIKRLAFWLDGQSLDGRSITGPLAGVADLRQGDAHAAGSKLRESLPIFGIPAEEEDYPRMCPFIIGKVAWSIAKIADSLPSM